MSRMMARTIQSLHTRAKFWTAVLRVLCDQPSGRLRQQDGCSRFCILNNEHAQNRLVAETLMDRSACPRVHWTRSK